jgi:hypothetical protein
MQPRSGFSSQDSVVRQPAPSNPSVDGVRLASHTESSQAFELSAPDGANRMSTKLDPRAIQRARNANENGNGVWYDRNTGKSSQAYASVQPARYQDGAGTTPNLPDALSLPPATPTEPPALPSSPASPLKTSPGRSLLEPEQVVPNPFPKAALPKDDRDSTKSPSDTKEPPSLFKKRDEDKAPAPPRRPDRSSIDCDSVRQFAKEQLDISNVQVDSSPGFIEGVKGKNQKNANTKQAFLDSAELRSWYDQDGNPVADGKLVDLRLGMVFLERADGTRTSFLLRKLCDADQAYMAQAWGMPVTCSIEDRSFPSRDFVSTTMTWKASGACHKPLYFEEVQLERYGHEWGPFAQPAISTVHFFGNLAVLPYKMGIHPMNECQYSLGYYRPGSCAPWTVGPIPLSLRGALFQAGAVTGAAAAIP